MGDVSVNSAEMKDFKLGKPALVCRWRLASGRLPLENRHLRALGRRSVNQAPVSTQLIAWAKQHIEWTLRDGSATNPDGVLMLIIDDGGQAAMTVGPYEGLSNADSGTLFARAINAGAEADEEVARHPSPRRSRLSFAHQSSIFLTSRSKPRPAVS